MNTRQPAVWSRITAVAMVWAIVGALLLPDAAAQRRINPVQNASKELQGKNERRQEGDSIDISHFVEKRDERGNIVLVDTVKGMEVPDSIANGLEPGGKVPRMIYPLLHSASVSVDIWDPVMRLFGQHYGLVEFSGEVNLHNRYIPVVEIGLGTTDYTPEDNNYTYRVPLTPYFRIGCNYNFLYNSNPDYLVMAGLRFGYSRFSYEVNDVTIASDYWGESATFNLPRQTGSFTYMQVAFGLKVKVFGPISMGWFIRYKAKLHESEAAYGRPWYIPGYGSRNGAITGSFFISYTLPFKKKIEEPEIPLD